ncbi:EAL domain-containing protein [Serratia marcescens]|uniref:EAL domain-containing protein n=1 Tax=Serratia marcescens TaxID=615 RepID=A0A939SV26_SERMA|nr:EAL domain-containing protein [Serratia marcescens]
MPYLRFELVEHAETASNHPLQQIVGGERLWLDDFGSGLANSPPSAPGAINTSRWHASCSPCSNSRKRAYSCSAPLIKMMNQHSDGVIVEGVETEQEWRLVQRSGALAAQGYYLSRPACFETLHSVPTLFAAPGVPA